MFETELQLFQKKLLLLEPVQYFYFGFGIQTTEVVLFKAMPERIYNPIMAMGFQQCLPFSWTTLRGKHCRHPIAVPIAVMGVVDTFGH